MYGKKEVEKLLTWIKEQKEQSTLGGEDCPRKQEWGGSRQEEREEEEGEGEEEKGEGLHSSFLITILLYLTL